MRWTAVTGDAERRRGGQVSRRLAGAYPADVDENRHVLGAFLLFVVANAGLLLVGRLGTALGALAAVGVTLFVTQKGPLIGIGGMERLAVHPLLVWAFLTGLSRLRSGRREGHDRPDEQQE